MNNNLTAILTYAVPTTVALLGLLWLLWRKNGGDDDSASASAVDTSKPALEKTSGNATVPSTLARERQVSDKKSDLKEAVVTASVDDSGDGAAQKTDFSNLLRQSTGVKTAQGSVGKVPAKVTGDHLSASSLRTGHTQVINSSPSAAPARKDLSPNMVHSSNDASMLSANKAGVSLTSAGVGLVSKKDPVQLLASQSEDKLKEDDAAIVQAKLSHSTLQPSQLDSSKPVFGWSSPISGKPSAQSSLSHSKQESPASKEAVQEVCSQASIEQVQSALTGSVSNILPSKSVHLESALLQSRKPPSTTEGKELKTDTRKEVASTAGAKNLEAKSAKTVAFNPDALANKDGTVNSGASCNTNFSNSNTSTSSSAPLIDMLSSKSEVVESKFQTVLQKTDSDSEQNRVQVLAKDEPCMKNGAAKDSNSNADGAAANNVASNNSTATLASKEIKSAGETAVTKDVEPNADIVETKDAKSEKDQASTSSSVIFPPSSAAAKVSPLKQAHDGKPTTETPTESQSKVSQQQKPKSAPSPSNSYSSKRRIKSGASDRASESSTDGHDGVAANPPSSGVSENGRVPDSGSPICDTNSEVGTSFVLKLMVTCSGVDL